MRAHTPSRERRADVRFAVAVVIGVAAFAWVVIGVQGLSHDLRTSNAARDALARQVQQLGGTPIAGSPGSRGDIGPAGAAGLSGPPGSPGPTGPPGAMGPTGPSGKSGRPGASGTPGQVGASGSPGTTGAAGNVGPSGAAGSPGPAGPAGPQGDTGPTGPAGPPPSGWTYTDPAGITYECAPDADGSTHYTCTPTSTPPKSPARGGLSLGMLVGTAAYRKLGRRPAL